MLAIKSEIHLKFVSFIHFRKLGQRKTSMNSASKFQLCKAKLHRETNHTWETYSYGLQDSFKKSPNKCNNRFYWSCIKGQMVLNENCNKFNRNLIFPNADVRKSPTDLWRYSQKPVGYSGINLNDEYACLIGDVIILRQHELSVHAPYKQCLK